MDIQQVMAEVHRPHCSDCDYDILCEGPESGCHCICHPTRDPSADPLGNCATRPRQTPQGTDRPTRE